MRFWHISRFVVAAAAIVFTSSADAGIIATFEASITSGSYNGGSVAGETLTLTVDIGDAALADCFGDCTSSNYFYLSDPAVSNTFTISGPNGGTFSQDVFFGHNFVGFDDRATGDHFGTRLGNVNSWHMRTTQELFGPGDGNLTGNSADIPPLVLSGTFGLNTPGFSATTIQGSGNTFNFSGLTSMSGSLTVPEPSASFVLGLGMLGLGLLVRRKNQ